MTKTEERRTLAQKYLLEYDNPIDAMESFATDLCSRQREADLDVIDRLIKASGLTVLASKITTRIHRLKLMTEWK